MRYRRRNWNQVMLVQTVIEASKVKLRLEIFGDDEFSAGSANNLLNPDWTIFPAKAGHHYHVAKRKASGKDSLIKKHSLE